MPKRPWKTNGLRRSAGRWLARYLRFVHSTSRVQFEPDDGVDVMIAGTPQIIAMWHGQFMLIPTVNPSDRVRTQAMVARHGDGDLIGEVLNGFNISMIRGAGAGDRKRDRGGATALRAAIRALDAGDNVAMTADVPPGPARVAGPGIVTLARLSGKPIRPVAVASSNYRAFDTWSRMTLNLPFSRIACVVGEPISVAADADDMAMAEALCQVQAELDRVTERAYAVARADPTRATPPHALPHDAPPVPMGTRLRAYRALSRGAAPFVPAILRRRQKTGKEDPARLDERLGITNRPRPAGPMLWVHAASVGETNAVLPMMREIADRRPDVNLLLTTGTRTSAELAERRISDLAVHQFVPVDMPEAVSRFLNHWRPDLCVLTESEIWPNLIIETDRRDIPIVIINARMSARSYKRWRRSKGFAGPLFSRVRLVLAQNEKIARQFANVGARNVEAVGNLKIDAPPLPVDNGERARLATAIGDRPRLLAASTHPGEDETVLDARAQIAAEIPDLLTIIAPRHPERGPEIKQLASELGLRCALRSAGEPLEPSTDVYVADTIGELGIFYSLCPVAFIGGSLAERGGQNPIEPTRFGCAIITGPHWYNFQDSFGMLLKSGGALQVQSAAELADAALGLLRSDVDLRRQQQNADESLKHLSGAQDRTVSALLGFLNDSEDIKRAS